MFQTTVQRNYTIGFAGQVLKDGPLRAKSARIASLTVGADPAASTNRISRAFGYSGEMPSVGTTQAALEAKVVVGGPTFFGILFHPKHYALLGTVSGGPLAASYDLPQDSEGEFTDMVTGLVAELFNETTGSKTMNFGDQVAFAPNNISAGNNAQAVPYGGLISVPAGSAVPTGFVLIPNARVVNTSTVSASAAGAAVSGLTVIQLTQ
jgi:hypothetical protein